MAQSTFHYLIYYHPLPSRPKTTPMGSMMIMMMVMVMLMLIMIQKKEIAVFFNNLDLKNFNDFL